MLEEAKKARQHAEMKAAPVACTKEKLTADDGESAYEIETGIGAVLIFLQGAGIPKAVRQYDDGYIGPDAAKATVLKDTGMTA